MNELTINIPLVSLIIPVYNVAEYISETLNSVLMQSFTNYEVIIVDDGSTDKTGEICDLFSKLDNRFVVIHQKNNGVSAARNIGVKKARGFFIGFADGDDILDRDYLKTLVDNIQSTNSDISVVNSYRFRNTYKRQCNKPNKIQIIDNESIINSVMYGRKLDVGPWGFITTKQVIQDHLFPEGMEYEDLYIMPSVYFACKRAVVSDAALYGYRQRSGSAMGSAKISQKRIDDYYKAIVHLKESFETGNEPIRPAVAARLCLESLRLLSILPFASGETAAKDELRLRTELIIHDTFRMCLADRECPTGLKIKVIIMKYCRAVVVILRRCKSILI